ncbi:hypothetical protein ANRL3_01608 [Anaerolineae bacterium]|nr:hypothetical protein ANRL3_01608 [Anaerolineae bacterium]
MLVLNHPQGAHLGNVAVCLTMRDNRVILLSALSPLFVNHGSSIRIVCALTQCRQRSSVHIPCRSRSTLIGGSRINIRCEVGIILILMVLGVILAPSACDSGLRQTAGIDHLLLTVSSDRSRVKVGDSVQIRFTITNTGQQPIVVESNDRPVLDILVAPAGGDVIRSWSAENPDKVSHRIEWKPGESKVLELGWHVREGDRPSPLIFLIGALHADPGPGQSAHVSLCLEGFCR